MRSTAGWLFAAAVLSTSFLAHGRDQPGAGAASAADAPASATSPQTNTTPARPLPPLAAYGKLPQVEQIALSPSGRSMVTLRVVDGQHQVAVEDLDDKAVGKWIVRLGPGKVRKVAWAGDDVLLVYASDTINLGMDWGFEHELSRVLVLDRIKRTGRDPLEYAPYAGFLVGNWGVTHTDGRWFLNAGLLRLERRADGDRYLKNAPRELGRLSLPDGRWETVADGRRDSRGWVLAADGKVLANQRYDERAGRSSLYAGASGDTLLLERNDPAEDVDVLGLGRTADRLLVADVDDTGTRTLVELSLPSGRQERLAFLDEPVGRVLVDDETRLWIGWKSDGLNPKLYFFDPARQARWDAALRALPGYRLDLVSASLDMNRFVVFGSAPDDAGSWWLIDVRTGQAKPLAEMYAGVPDDAVAPWSVLHYKAADGLALDGIVTLPRGAPAEKLPLVVLPHGGPTSHDSPGFDWLAQAFASRGYAVWQPNFRGSTGHGSDFTRAGWGEWGRKMQSDISDGVAELARRGWIDPGRACIVGWSYGGYAAMAGVTLQHGLYRCAVSIGGVADLQMMLRQSRSDRGRGELRYWERFIGAESGSDLLEALSPADQAARADAPLLLIHGKDDTVVRIEQSQRMASALRRVGKPVTLLELDGEDHHLSIETTRLATLEAMMAFVLKHNPVHD